MKKLSLDYDLIKDLYLNKQLSSKDIAEQLNVSQQTIRKILKRLKVKIRNNSEAKLKGKIKPTKEELYDLYWNKGLSTSALEKKYKIHNKTIARWMKEYGIKIRELGIAQSNLRLLSKEKLEELYIKKKLSCIKIGKIYNTQDESVRRILIHYNIKRRDNIGKNNGTWAGGHGYEPYASEFTKKLKEEIKKRDNHTCQRCNDKSLKNNKKIKDKKWLEIHHIDHNKKNNSKNNLITLCHQCNMDANKNVDYWIKFFTNKLRCKKGIESIKYKNQNKRVIKLFSMFSGYGGAEFSLKKANINFECVGYSEIDKYAIQCYEQNFPNTKNYGDVRLIDPNDLEDFDLLTGGFPCQSFSIVGKGKGELDIRGTLFKEIIRIAEAKKPKYILLENVKGLITKKHNKTFNKILRELERIGYFVHWKVLNSKDYGIPQNRERVWFVCFRKDLEMNFEFPGKEELKIFLKDILEDIEFRELKPFCFGYYGKQKRITILKDINSKIMPTLTTSRTHTTQYILNKSRTKMRNLTKRECFRLQGFLNDEINLDGLSDNQSHKLAGNGWDINLVSKIFKEITSKIK